MTDLAALLQAARDDCEEIIGRLPELDEHRYAREWVPDHVATRVTPHSRPLWTGTDDRPVQATWLDCLAALHAASWELLHVGCERINGRRRVVRDTPPAGITPHSQLPQSLGVADVDARIVAAQLAWCQDREFAHEQDVARIRQACEQVAAAAQRLRDLWPDRQLRPCLHCEARRPLRGGKWCGWCQRVHQRGGVCRVCVEAERAAEGAG